MTLELLILGGTRFLGRHLADQALQRGHRVTLLNRGQTQPGLFPEAEHLRGDRNGDLRPLLGGRSWDAVLDTCAYVPRQVRSLAELLAGKVGHYQIVSSISAYAAFEASGTREDAPLAQLDDPTVELVDPQTYGGLKALCEAAAVAGFGESRVCRVRPGLIVGPHDPTGRWSWWLQRMARGGEVLAPGLPDAPVQFIDARDIATWMLDRAESGSDPAGAFNLAGPDAPLSMAAFLQALQETLRPDAVLRWVDESFLLEQGVAPWSELPVWLAGADAALHRVDTRRARATGLRCRPLRESIVDTWAWLQAAGPSAFPSQGAPGLASAREAALLAAWNSGCR